MESKLLIGGKTIIDHTNEQQKMLAIKRQEIAVQVYKSLFFNHLLTESHIQSQFCLLLAGKTGERDTAADGAAR